MACNKALGQGFPVAAIVRGRINYREFRVRQCTATMDPEFGPYTAKTMPEDMSRDDNAGWAKIEGDWQKMTRRLNHAACHAD